MRLDRDIFREYRRGIFVWGGVLLVAVVVLLSDIRFDLFPTQEADMSVPPDFGPALKELVFVQEVTLKRTYLTGLEVILGSKSDSLLNTNRLTVLDSAGKVIYRKRFTNQGMDMPRLTVFRFPDPVKVGKGRKIRVVISSEDGSRENFLSLARTRKGGLGKSYLKSMRNNDVVSTITTPGEIYPVEGALCIRTFEAGSSWLNLMKLFWILLAVAIGLAVWHGERLIRWVEGIRPDPARIYLITALAAGTFFVFLTPPLQVADENNHLYRSYQIRDLDWFWYRNRVPEAFFSLNDSCKTLYFGLFEKTSLQEISNLRTLRIDPDDGRLPGYETSILSHLPQALGFRIADLFFDSPVELLYAGRVVNLLVSVLLVWLAIRMMPFGRWLFYLLGLMPMALTLMASLSNYAMVIGMAFLFVALVARMAWGDQPVRRRELLALFMAAFVLAHIRELYLLFLPLFLVIPRRRIGSTLKYAGLFVLLITVSLLSTRYWSLAPLFQPKPQTGLQIYEPEGSGFPAGHPVQYASLAEQQDAPLRPKFDPNRQQGAPDGTDPVKQKAYILEHPGTFAGTILRTFLLQKRSFFIETLIGRLGWLKISLPSTLVNLYFLALILTALATPNPGNRIRWRDKLLMAVLFLLSLGGVATYQYLNWTVAEAPVIQGVSSRYFLPFVPLLFLLLLNNRFRALVTGTGLDSGHRMMQQLLPETERVPEDRQRTTLILRNSSYLMLIVLTTITLMVAVYALVEGFYLSNS